MSSVAIAVGAVGISALLLKGSPNMTQRLKDWANNGNSTQPPSVGLSPIAHQQPYPIQEDHVTRSFHVISDRSESSLTRKMLSITSAALVVYIAYSYYSSNNNTKRVIDKVEDTAQETQELVKECDDNNQKRIEELDERAAERTNDLSVEIRGEQRAHFEVLSKQLNCVTQVCLQTINAVAHGLTNPAEDGEAAQPNEELIAYAEKAQEMSDNLFDRDTYLKAVDIHVEECRAQIGTRQKKKMKTASTMEPEIDDMMMSGGMTAGGSDDTNDDLEPNGSGSNQYIRKMSAPGMNNSLTRSDSKGNKGNNASKPKSLMEFQFVKNMKLGYLSEYCTVQYADPVYLFVRDHSLLCGGLLVVFAAYGSSRYMKKPNNTQKKLL